MDDNRYEQYTGPVPGQIPAPPAAGGLTFTQPVTRRQPACPLRRTKGRDLALAAVLAAACFLFWDALLWAEGLGLAEAAGLAILLPAALIYLHNRPGRMTGFGRICAALYLIGAVSIAFSGDGSLKFLTVMTLALLFLLTVMNRLGLWTGSGLRCHLLDFFRVGFGMSYGRIGRGFWGLLHTGEEKAVKSKRSLALTLGLLCSIPVLVIVIPLLISSDAAFAGMLGKLDWSFAGKGLLSLHFGLFLALLLFSLLFTSEYGPKPMNRTVSRGLDPVAIAAFLGALSAAYVLYLLSQFAYFTNAFRGLLPKDFTVAEYARRGFFEMCGIVTINLVLVAVAMGVCRKKAGKLPGAVKGLCLFLCVFSLILVATALSKMVLYMHSFGLTRLRVLTSAFMVLLAAVVLFLALRLFIRRVPVAKLAIGLGAAILIAVSLANVDGMVSRYNVKAWKTGSLQSLDIEMIRGLGDGAVPVLDELSRCGDAEIAREAKAELKLRRSDDAESDLRSWNLIGQQAADILRARLTGENES